MNGIEKNKKIMDIMAGKVELPKLESKKPPPAVVVNQARRPVNNWATPLPQEEEVALSSNNWARCQPPVERELGK